MKITAKKHNKIVNDLLEIGDITITLFEREVNAHIIEWGVLVNGFFVEFRTTSPEGYDIKFAIFDDDLLKLKY